MLSSRPPASAALGSSSLASSSSPVSVLLLSSITTTSAFNQSGSNKGKDELLCQVADNFPSNLLQSTDPPLDAIVLLNNGTMFKTLLSCNPPKVSRSGLACVQCVEVFPDTMNHCVPEWEADGREMDVIWEPTDLFSPSKGKWDSGHMRKSDPAFVPEHDFEELCWEDGQLLVVMQGLNGKCNMRNRNGWQVNAGETAPVTSGLPIIGIDSMFDAVGTAELVDPSTVNMHSQEDELLSWLQHPPEDLVDKLEIPSDTLTSSMLLANGERLHPMDLRHCGIRRNLAVSEGIENNSVSKTVRNDNLVTFPTNLVNKSGQGNYGVVNQHHVSTLAWSSVVNTATMTSKDSCESSPVIARVEVLPTQMNFASVGMPSGSSAPITSTSTMNFSNFLRPAVAFKANLHSLGMANGPSGAERLKQLDRVAVDALSESIDSTTKHLRLIAPRRDGIALPVVSTFSQSVRGPFIHNSVPSFPLQGGAEQDASATGAVNRCFGIGGQSDSWNSSLISNTNFGTDRITEVLEVAEPSDISSSGGSEESDGVDGKRGASMCKRKFYDEDIEIQSKALENGALGGKNHTTGGGSNIKKSRAAENHNRSERRRRDRITEKMRALQALVPNSHKTDKASMLEEAIAYIKALKAQIQMMSCRGGMYFSPMLMPQGMQHVQMAAWPHMGLGMGMNMGMGMNATMGMFDMHMAMAMAAAGPRQFTPVMAFPGAVIPAVQTTGSSALESARSTHGVLGHVIPSPPSQMMARVRPELPEVGTCDSSPAVNVVSPMSFPASKQQRPVQVCEPALLRVDHVT